MLPLRVRVGNTWRIQKGILFSIDGERRFYNEGGNDQDFVYVGTESFASKNVVVRFGIFGQKIGNPKDRHVTAGFTFTTQTKSYITYAYEEYKLDQEKVKRSVMSFQFPLSDSEPQE